jgi:hypothetical protein
LAPHLNRDQASVDNASDRTQFMKVDGHGYDDHQLSLQLLSLLAVAANVAGSA